MSRARYEKPCLILDLDETIIYSEPRVGKVTSKQKLYIKQFRTHYMDESYIVIERPGLQKFLDFVFKHFKVSVWTAGSKDYASFIVENVILTDDKKRRNSRQLHMLLFDYHCRISENEKNGLKDLSMLWDVYKLPGYTKQTTFIMDDHPDVYDRQPGNCIFMVPFDSEIPNFEADTFLNDLKPKLTKLVNDIKSGKKTKVKSINAGNK